MARKYSNPAQKQKSRLKKQKNTVASDAGQPWKGGHYTEGLWEALESFCVRERRGQGHDAEYFGALVPSVVAEDGTAAGIYDLRRQQTGRGGGHHGRALLAPGYCHMRKFPGAFEAVFAPGVPRQRPPRCI